MRLLPFRKITSQRQTTALVPQVDGLAIAYSEYLPGKGLSLSRCEFVAWGEESIEKTLRAKLRQHGVLRKPIATSLSLGDYAILSIEAPEVPAVELKSAIRWQIRDSIDYHIDDAVLDVFDAPAAGVNGQQKTLYVVVTRRSTIAQHIKPFQDIDANLTTIDIPELALRNIVTRLPQDEAGVVFVYLSQDSGVLIITRQNTLYLARSLEFGFAGMRAATPLGDPFDLVETEVDRLGLEIQRSMDYYDRYFVQPPLSSLIIAPMPEKIVGLTERLSEHLGIDAAMLDINEIAGLDLGIDAHLQSQCLLAIGTALREEKMIL